jgi:hypothetical protein
VRDPIAITKGLDHIAKQSALRELFQSPTLTQGSVDDILQQDSFKQLTQDPQTMTFFEQAGLEGATPEEKQRNLATQLSTYAKNAQQLKTTPEYRDVAHDPEIIEKIKAGNYLSLLSNDKVKRLTQLLSQATTSTNTKLSTTTQTNTVSTIVPAITSQKIYKWKDKQGHINFTSEKPDIAQVDGDVQMVSQ